MALVHNPKSAAWDDHRFGQTAGGERNVLFVARWSERDLRAVAGTKDHGEGAARFQFRHAVIGVLKIIQPFDSNMHKQRGKLLAEHRPDPFRQQGGMRKDEG